MCGSRLNIWRSWRQSARRAEASPDTGICVSTAQLLQLRHEIGVLSTQARGRSTQPGDVSSRERGPGLDPEEVRPYLAGDDVRRIDWRVSARRGAIHTRTFHRDVERQSIVAVDLRNNMFFGSSGDFKSVTAARAAALAAWQAGEQQEPLGAVIIGDDHNLMLAPRRGRQQVLQILNQLAVATQRLEKGRAANARRHDTTDRFVDGIRRMTAGSRGRRRILLLSDWLPGDPAASASGMLLLRRLTQQSEVTVAAINDPLELDMPTRGYAGASLTGAMHIQRAGQRHQLVVNKAFSNAYQRTMHQHRQDLQLRCRQAGATYLAIDQPGLARRGARLQLLRQLNWA